MYSARTMDSFSLPKFCNRSCSNETVSESGDHQGATIISPILMSLAGLLGNILALYVLHKNKSQSVFYTLVAGLAWTDLTGIICTSPVPVVQYVNNRKWVGGEMLCKFNGFCMVCFGIATPLIVCAMAIERLFAVRFPFFHNQYCRKKFGRIVLITIWITVFVIGIFPLLGFGRYVIQYPCTWCFLDFHSYDPVSSAYGYFYSSVNLTVIIVMSSCNIYVMFILLRVRYLKKVTLKEQGNLEPVFHENAKARKKFRKQKDIEKQMIVLMCVITTVFAICWAPLMVQIIITMVTGKSNFVIDLTTVRLASLNQTLDPWLYILLRKSFIRKLCSYIRRCCSITSPRTSNHDDDKNNHANHLRCFRKQCHVANPQYQYHVQIHIPQAAQCVVHYKRTSTKSKSDESKKQQQLSVDLPDIAQGQSQKEVQPDVTDVKSSDPCKQCGTIHSSSKSSSGNKGGYLSVAFIPHNSNDTAEECKPFDECSSAVEISKSRDSLSDDNHLESDVFITKSTDLSADLLSPQQNARQKLLSDLTPRPSTNRFSLRKKRAKSYT
ncbi:prostaglandin E2 receptor EP3 subtype-like [Mytilus edulis]|uniref:prostaglandin E2 receptor EP3 subtype-like n=1 Tax=Mytilus edulis TaxID=6550 RepID=UPI0039F0E1FF